MFIRNLLLGSMFFGTAALADGGGEPTNVSLVDLQQKCADLQADPQTKPIKVKVTCNELSFIWKAGDATPSTLANQRNIGAMVMMKSFQVAHDFFPADAVDTAVSCSTFVKYEHKVQNVDVELSCAEIAQVQDLGAYCLPIIEQRITDDPALVTELPTREVVSLCPQNAGH